MVPESDRPMGWVRLRDKLNVRVYPVGTQLNTLTTKKEPPHRVTDVVEVWGVEFESGGSGPVPNRFMFQRYGTTTDGKEVKLFDMEEGCEYRYYYGVEDSEECWVGIEQY